jgi:hypothetical protein
MCQPGATAHWLHSTAVDACAYESELPGMIIPIFILSRQLPGGGFADAPLILTFQGVEHTALLCARKAIMPLRTLFTAP